MNPAAPATVDEVEKIDAPPDPLAVDPMATAREIQCSEQQPAQRASARSAVASQRRRGREWRAGARREWHAGVYPAV
jgi:hypothetical protein